MSLTAINTGQPLPRDYAYEEPPPTPNPGLRSHPVINLENGAPFTADRFRVSRRNVETALAHGNQLAGLKHPHIDEPHDVLLHRHASGILEVVIIGRPISQSLADLLDHQHPFTKIEIAAVGKQLVDALKFAHSHHLVHGSLDAGKISIRWDKQGNILASLNGFSIEGLPGSFRQNPLYQDRREPLSRQADYYSLGLILMDMALGGPQNRTSEAPFENLMQDVPAFRHGWGEELREMVQTLLQSEKHPPEPELFDLSFLNIYSRLRLPEWMQAKLNRAAIRHTSPSREQLQKELKTTIILLATAITMTGGSLIPFLFVPTWESSWMYLAMSMSAVSFTALTGVKTIKTWARMPQTGQAIQDLADKLAETRGTSAMIHKAPATPPKPAPASLITPARWRAPVYFPSAINPTKATWRPSLSPRR